MLILGKHDAPTTTATRPLPVVTYPNPRARVLGSPSPEALARALRLLADIARDKRHAQEAVK